MVIFYKNKNSKCNFFLNGYKPRSLGRRYFDIHLFLSKMSCYVYKCTKTLGLRVGLW